MSEPFSFDAEHVVLFHDACIEFGKWPDEEAPAHPPGPIWPWIEENHGCNARLWREENNARRTDVDHAAIVASKRAIDRFNQLRNDAIERIDDALLSQLAGMRGDARLHSETPGMMIDRLSILALKLRAMSLEAARVEAGSRHVARCMERARDLEAQRDDLAGCLAALLRECAEGKARFRVHRAHKMYNDPQLNPALYRPGDG